MHKMVLIAPTGISIKILIDLSYPTLDHVCDDGLYIVIIACFQLWGIVMKDQRKIDVKARGFQVNIEQRGTNGQREGKECKTRRQEVEKLRMWDY